MTLSAGLRSVAFRVSSAVPWTAESRTPQRLRSTFRQSRAIFASGAAPSGLEVLQGDEATAMARVSAARVSCKSFLKTPVPAETMDSIINMVLRVPTSFNTQPFRIVLASSDQAKAAVAAAMAEVNRPKILNAAVTAVILADLEPDPRKAGELLKESAPKMAAYADMLPTLLPIYAGEEGKNSMTEWAFKNAGLVGMRLLDAATSHGLATAMLEGIDDEGSLLKAVGAEGPRFRIPFVVCVGHPDPDAEAQRLAGFSNNATPRFSEEDVVSTI